MNNNLIISWSRLCWLFLLVSLFAPTVAVPGQILSNVDQKQNIALVVLDSLEAEFHSANNVVRVKGSFRNVSKVALRGFLTLSLLSANGGVLHTVDLPANDHQAIQDGQTIKFDAVLSVINAKGASQVSVEFTRD